MKIDKALDLSRLGEKLDRVFQVAGPKILSIHDGWDPDQGTPVFTEDGRYTTRGWTEWTQGFQFGCAVLQFEASGDEQFLEIGRTETLQKMAPHVTHMGVHDHGFNNCSTYGNLRRLMLEGAIPDNAWERHFYELALKASGAVQAARWTPIQDGNGYIHSFNGPHSLFSDTIRTCRILGVGHQLGHVLMGENDRRISLLDRLIQHARATADYNVYYGDGRDAYDIRGRVVHESIFNVHDGRYRCPSTQQGYAPFSTWTRGLAWVVTGYPELLEYLAVVTPEYLAPSGVRAGDRPALLRPATASAVF
jgi:unsaturated chondroitin disaccharide hydrolase